MYEYRATIRRIIDGDTIVADIDLGLEIWARGQHLRLYGIDTPEVRTRDLEEKAAGLLAKARVQALLPPGREVTIRTHKDRSGKYGRWLVTVDLPEHQCTLSELLILEGHTLPEKF